MMKTKIQILLSLCLLIAGVEKVFAQDISNRGTDFWAGYGHHQSMEGSNNQDMILYFSAEQAANVTVTINNTSYVRNYSVPANGVLASEVIPKAGAIDARLYTAPCSFVPPGFPCGGEGTFTSQAIHITSDVPIVAYAHIYDGANSGATMLMPVESWGYYYQTINSKQEYAANCFSWAYVIAQHDNTVVEITPSQVTRRGAPANVPFTVTLNRGQIYQTMAGPEAGSTKPEFTGTKVRSIANAAGECYPIAVFAGSSRTRGTPVSCGAATGGDNDNQQCFPSQAWGKRYLTAPTSNSVTASTPMWNTFKIAVKDPTTVVKRNGVPLTGLTNNTYQFITNTADFIEADKPVMVAEFIHSGTACFGGGGVGDPEMIYISPIEQGIKRIGFYRNNRTGITVNYLTLIIPTPGISSLVIDGSSTFDHVYAHPNLAGYSVVVKRWPSAQAQATASSDSAFTAITYGLGSVESYGYNAGTYLKNLNAVSSIQNTPDPSTPQHPFACVGTPINLSVLMAYQPTKIDWLLSQVPELSPNADIIDNAPVSTGTVLVNGITYYKYTLPGTYTFNAADTFYLPINGYHPNIENCYNRENFRVPVIVKPSPVANYAITHSGCTLDPVTFTGDAGAGNGYTVGTYNWTFPGPATATGQIQSQTLPPGTYPVTLSVVTTDGCADDTTRNITIYDKPPAEFQATPAALCEGLPFTVTDTSSASIAVNSWYWDFGDGNVQTVTTGPSVTHTYATPGVFTIRHAASSSVSCVSDTVTRQVTVYAKPTVSFINDAAGCLAPSGVVNFTGNATVTDAQNITSYAWNFGDPNANGGNPNTSVLQNPSHSYQQGTYTITFTATTENGCTRDATQTVTFNLKPALAYPALTAVCENAAPLSIASATVTNAVPGTGVYIGPGTSSAGMFDPAAAGYGTHTIWYKFTTTANCIDSISQTIVVNARPRTTFTIPASGCLPANGQVQFTNTSTIPDGQTMTWNWNFGDPNANGGNPNTSTAQNPTHNYLEGTYTITLQATTNNGCVKDSVITTSFAVTPVLNYAALPAICENAAPVSVAFATVTNGVTGTGVYSGPGTTSAGMFDPAVAGYGPHTITYTFTSAGGCVQTTTQNIMVNARPRTTFTVPAAGCLPTNGQVQLTNTSTVPDGQTMTWNWNFGDPNANGGNPNTSTAQNPTHNYLEGTYTITLQATTNNGCVKDSVMTTSFAVTPALSYAALPAVCENVPAFSIANATVTNGVTGTGVYSGPGTTSAGMFDPATAGAGTHQITYTYTSAGGCVATVQSSITVNPRPVSSFIVSGNGGTCLGQAVTLTDGSTIPSGAITTWNWDLGDGNTASYNNGNPFTVNYTNANTYTVQLTTVSDNGCISLPVTRTVRVSPLPVVAFTTPTGICMPGGSSAFTNSTTVADNSGLTYNWDFGDGNSSTATNPSHTYATSGTYNVTLTATSAFGCTQQATEVMDDFYDKPVASFSVSPQELCQGADNVFTDGSNAPNSSITRWEWNFDDGTSSTPTLGTPNPTKRFNTPGTYDVSLIVTNTQGCVSAPFVLPVTVHLQPVIDAGRSYVLPLGTSVQLQATANAGNISFNWTPATGLSDATILNPMLTALADNVYTLTATGDFGCTATDEFTLKILKPVKVPNVFSPNGDNIHDQWVIPNLLDYPGCTVEVFNRYGQQVFYSAGYGTAWNGTFKGKDVPVGTYYYVIKLENGFKPLTGSVTILR